MANERIPNDPYRDPIRDPILGNDMPGDDMRSPAQLDNDLQVDPELAEGTGERWPHCAVRGRHRGNPGRGILWLE